MAEEAVLSYLENNKEITDSGEFAAERGLDHNEIVNVIKSLHGFRYVDAEVGNSPHHSHRLLQLIGIGNGVELRGFLWTGY